MFVMSISKGFPVLVLLLPTLTLTHVHGWFGDSGPIILFIQEGPSLIAAQKKKLKALLASLARL